MGWEGLNHPQIGSNLQGWNSGLGRARGQTVLSSCLIPILILIGEPLRLPLKSCSNRGEVSDLSRLGAQNCRLKGPLPVYLWAGVDSSVGLHPSLNSRANSLAHSDPCPSKQNRVLRFPESFPLLPCPPALCGSLGSLDSPSAKPLANFAVTSPSGQDCLRQVNGLRLAIMPGVFSVNREGK